MVDASVPLCRVGVEVLEASEVTARDRLIEALKAAQEYDAGRQHKQAEDALLDYIDDEEIRALYESVPKWYA